MGHLECARVILPLIPNKNQNIPSPCARSSDSRPAPRRVSLGSRGEAACFQEPVEFRLPGAGARRAGMEFKEGSGHTEDLPDNKEGKYGANGGAAGHGGSKEHVGGQKGQLRRNIEIRQEGQLRRDGGLLWDGGLRRDGEIRREGQLRRDGVLRRK